MVIYEYTVKEYDELGHEAVISFLNAMAEEGWEYVEGLYEGISPMEVLFRKEKKVTSTKKITSKRPKVTL